MVDWVYPNRKLKNVSFMLVIRFRAVIVHNLKLELLEIIFTPLLPILPPGIQQSRAKLSLMLVLEPLAGRAPHGKLDIANE